MAYDCTKDVLAHKERVRFWIDWIVVTLQWLAEHHDESKLQSPEKEMFDEFTPKLKEMEFGGKEYNDALASMGEALKHHYTLNPHHPEHFPNGIAGMSIWNIVEMLADWMAAASLKDEPMDLEFLQKRFDISPQLLSVFANTLWNADMDVVNNRVPLSVQPRTNFIVGDPRANKGKV